MSKSARWALLVSAVAVLGASLVLAFVLVLSTSGVLAERHFVWLFWVNVAVAVALMLVIGLAALRLLARMRRGKFGSRLLARLAAVFALVGVVPGLLIYGVSYQFVTRSIDTWFDVQVASALDAGLAQPANVGMAAHDARSRARCIQQDRVPCLSVPPIAGARSIGAAHLSFQLQTLQIFMHPLTTGRFHIYRQQIHVCHFKQMRGLAPGCGTCVKHTQTLRTYGL